MTDFIPGITYDEPEAVYFDRALDVASNSGLKIIGAKSPMHYHFAMTAPEDEDETQTAAQVFGRGFHSATLEPHKFANTYAVLPANAPQRPTAAMVNAKNPSPESLARQDWWAKWEADNRGRIVVPAKAYDAIAGMGQAMRAHVLEIPDTSGNIITIRGGELFDLCQKEVTLRWIDARTGIKCKARVDLHCAELGFGGDLKSCEDASPDGFARAIASYRYHQQHVHYCDGAQATGTPWSKFLFFACEKAKPYAPAVHEIPAIAEERGRFLRDKAMDRLKRCLETGRWPTYSNKIIEAMLPAYAFYEATDSTD